MYTKNIRNLIKRKLKVAAVITCISSIILWGLFIYLNIQSTSHVSLGEFIGLVCIGGSALINSSASILSFCTQSKSNCQVTRIWVVSVGIWCIYFILYLLFCLKPENIAGMIVGSIISAIINIILLFFLLWYSIGISALNTLYIHSNLFDNTITSLINTSSEYNQKVEDYNCLLRSINNLFSDYKPALIDQFTSEIEITKFTTDIIGIFSFWNTRKKIDQFSKNISLFSGYISSMKRQQALLCEIMETKMPVLYLIFEIQEISEGIIPANLMSLLKHLTKAETKICSSIITSHKNVLSILKKDDDEKYKTEVRTTINIYRQTLDRLDIKNPLDVKKFIDMLKRH